MKKAKFKNYFISEINRFINCHLFDFKIFVYVLISMLLASTTDAKLGKNSLSKKQSAAYSSMYGPRYQTDQYKTNDCNELDCE